MGGDLPPDQRASLLESFNPRPRMGGDDIKDRPGISVDCFNPRPRMGGDSGPQGRPAGRAVSIHAPAWGATIQQGHAFLA